MALPEKMRAYKSVSAGSAGVREVPLPALRPDYVLVKVSHVALNPTDWKHIYGLPKENATVGCDYSGTVVKAGPDVSRTWKPGQRIAGGVHGVNHLELEDGAFGEYLVAKGDIQLEPPASMSDAEAATLGVGLVTTGLGLHVMHQLPWPGTAPPAGAPDSERTILVYGASTASGLYGLQFAKLSGFTTIAVCSERNFDLARSYGADMVFDYKDAEKCVQDIRAATHDGLKYVYDCVSDESSGAICTKAIGPEGGVYVNLLGSYKCPRDDVTTRSVLAYTSFGEALEFPQRKIGPVPEHFEFSKKWVATCEKLLAEGKIKPVPLDVREGGLDEIQKGLEDLKSGKVSGKKLVYKLSG